MMSDDNWMDETTPSRRGYQAHDRTTKRRSDPSQIPPRVWIFAFVAAILLFALFGLWGLYLFRGRFGGQEPTPTAIIWTPTPAATPTTGPTPTPLEPAAAEQPGEATPTVSAEITIGGYVEVAETGGYGLSLREGPGANYARMDVAADDEVFVVVEGPRTAAGSPWWRIRDPDNEERTWWAIGNYLRPIEHP